MWEYYRIHQYAERLRIVVMQYDDCIGAVKRIINKKEGYEQDTHEQGCEEETPDEDEMAIDSFMVINRTPEYLKESTLSYLKNQQLDALAHRINPHEWRDYTGQVVVSDYQASKKNHVSKGVKRSLSSISAPAWRSTKKRKSITGITLSLPIDQSKFWLSSFFGPRKKPSGKWGFHYGIDMAAQRGTPIKPAAAGVVEFAGYHKGYGNTIVIMHDKVYKTRYAHLDSIQVHVGQKVTSYQTIGTVGDTGFTRKTGKDASHLHFELYEYGKQINPLPYLVA
jgi:murein DD-endopeptidase MepM/ murein hydrolase activator NlpD